MNHEQGLTFYRRFVTAGDVCFDIGAHMGDRTSMFLELGAAQVVCVEPQPLCVEALRKRFRGDPRVAIVAKGCGEHPGLLPLFVCDEANTISTFQQTWKAGRFQGYQWPTTIDIEMTTVEDLIESFGVPSFCKIDVEGYEGSVLRGLHRMIPGLSFEFSCEFWDDTKACLEHLTRLGYQRFNCGLGEAAALALPLWQDAARVLKFLENVPNPQLWGDIYARSSNILTLDELRSLLATEEPVILQIGTDVGSDSSALIETFPPMKLFCIEMQEGGNWAEDPCLAVVSCAPSDQPEAGAMRPSTGRSHTRPAGAPRTAPSPDISMRGMSLDAWAARHGVDAIDYIRVQEMAPARDLILGGIKTFASARYVYLQHAGVGIHDDRQDLAAILAMLPDFELVTDYGGHALLSNRRWRGPTGR